jgi:HTH-type transcriptional regulator / antitoxin HipB
MIANERQYAILERKLKNCISLRKKLLLRHNVVSKDKAAEEQIDDLQKQAEVMTEQMKDYLGLTMGRIAPPDLSEINNLPQNLIRARVALGWSQQEFARQLGIAPSQLHRWESRCYRAVCLDKVLLVANLLHSALRQQDRTFHLSDKSLKLGADWFNADFRNLPD